MEKKKTRKMQTVLIVIVAVILTVFLIPLPYSLSDGGSTGFCSLLSLGFVYDVRNCHELRANARDIEGVNYNYTNYTPSPARYNVGTRVSIFGIVVFDNTQLDTPLDEHLKYEEEVKELIDYYNAHRVDNVELRSIFVSERDTLRYVELSFCEVDKLEVSDRIVKAIKGYLDENPDSFLFDDYKLKISARHNELVDKTLNSESWKVYEAEYDISLPDKSITELKLSPAMIPDTVPIEYDFEDVQKISFSYVSSVSEDKEMVLRSMYPNAEIASE